jgi:uncharacterized protein (TIGR02996 family)
MDQEQAFLQAIRNRPGSRTECLVFGDWLAERGDPRGEFILHHCRGRPEADELLFRHEQEWIAPLQPFVGNWQWRHGLLHWITLDAASFLANAERWLPRLPILGIHLRRAKPHIADLVKCTQLRHVTGLYLGDNQLDNDALIALARSPHLGLVRDLFLHDNSFGLVGLQAIADSPCLPRLRTLCLAKNHLKDEGVTTLASCSGLRQLRTLILSMVGIRQAGVQALAGSPLLGRLRELMLTLNLLPAGCLAELARSKQMSRLRTLDYSFNNPDSADLEALARSPHAAELRTLGLDGYQCIRSAGIRALATATHLGRLVNLSLGSGAWDAGAAGELARSAALPRLRRLSVTQGGNRDNGIPAALLDGQLIRRLHVLDVNINDAEQDVVPALAAHKRPLRLRAVEASVSAEMVPLWQELLGKGTLAALQNLRLLAPPAEAIRALVEPGRLPKLRVLDLSGLLTVGDELQELFDSPLFKQLRCFRVWLDHDMKKHGPEVLDRLLSAWRTSGLQQVGLTWSLSVAQLRQLVASPPPPRLVEFDLEVHGLPVEGMHVLASWPALRQLRRLRLTCSSASTIAGLEALADSPHAGELLRIDLRNANVAREAIPALRQRFGLRFAVGGRSWPQRVNADDWSKIRGDQCD